MANDLVERMELAALECEFHGFVIPHSLVREAAAALKAAEDERNQNSAEWHKRWSEVIDELTVARASLKAAEAERDNARHMLAELKVPDLIEWLRGYQGKLATAEADLTAARSRIADLEDENVRLKRTHKAMWGRREFWRNEAKRLLLSEKEEKLP